MEIRTTGFTELPLYIKFSIVHSKYGFVSELLLKFKLFYILKTVVFTSKLFNSNNGHTFYKALDLLKII